MATKKMEGRVEVIEEQLAGIYGEMAIMKGELQWVGQLEIKVDLMLTKLVLKRTDDAQMGKPRKNSNLRAGEE